MKKMLNEVRNFLGMPRKLYEKDLRERLSSEGLDEDYEKEIVDAVVRLQENGKEIVYDREIIDELGGDVESAQRAIDVYYEHLKEVGLYK